MIFRLGRIGPYLSDRIVIAPGKNGHFSPRIAGSCWDWLQRIVSWIYAPESYTDENRRTIQCFRQMIKPIGDAKLQRICNRYNIDLKEMEESGSPLLSRTIAQISVGIEDVDVVTMDEAIGTAKTHPDRLPPFFPDDLSLAMRQVSCSEELSAANFARLYDILGNPAKSFPLPPMAEINGSCPTECLAWLFFDQFLADRERLKLQKENPKVKFEVFAHNFSVRIMRREINAGTLIAAPNHANGTRQFYRVGAKLITGEGMVSYCLVPATQGSDLRPIRFYRGTSTTPAEVDAFSSFITNLGPQIGSTARKSAKPFEAVLRRYLPPMEIVAGHSLGSTLAQMETVKNPTIRRGYYFSGPGLTDEKIAAFNERMQRDDAAPVSLVINHAERDDLSVFGSKHLGYQAPDKVTITYRHYSALQKIRRTGVHTMMWNNQKYYGIEGGHSSNELDQFLDHQSRCSLEWIRSSVGPYVAKVFRVIRDVFRWVFGSRTPALTGLEIGVYAQARDRRVWQKRLVKPHKVALAMENLAAIPLRAH